MTASGSSRLRWENPNSLALDHLHPQGERGLVDGDQPARVEGGVQEVVEGAEHRPHAGGVEDVGVAVLGEPLGAQHGGERQYRRQRQPAEGRAPAGQCGGSAVCASWRGPAPVSSRRHPPRVWRRRAGAPSGPPPPGAPACFPRLWVPARMPPRPVVGGLGRGRLRGRGCGGRGAHGGGMVGARGERCAALWKQSGNVAKRALRPKSRMKRVPGGDPDRQAHCSSDPKPGDTRLPCGEHQPLRGRPGPPEGAGGEGVWSLLQRVQQPFEVPLVIPRPHGGPQPGVAGDVAQERPRARRGARARRSGRGWRRR